MEIIIIVLSIFIFIYFCFFIIASTIVFKNLQKQDILGDITKKIDNIIENESDINIVKYFNNKRIDKMRKEYNIDELLITFDNENKNLINFHTNDNRLITSISCPPKENGIDLINYGDLSFDLCEGYYLYDFDGLVIITTNGVRHMYYKGLLLDSTNK